MMPALWRAASVQRLPDAALASCSKSSAVATVFSPCRTISTRDDTEQKWCFPFLTASRTRLGGTRPEFKMESLVSSPANVISIITSLKSGRLSEQLYCFRVVEVVPGDLHGTVLGFSQNFPHLP